MKKNTTLILLSLLAIIPGIIHAKNINFEKELKDAVIQNNEDLYFQSDSTNKPKKNILKYPKKANYPKPIAGITFSRIDFGLTKPMQGGGFNLDGENEIFNYRPSKTWNFGFDVLQLGYRFNKNFKSYVSAGFDWTYYRLNKDYIFDPDESPYESKQLSTDDIRKNKLTATYLRLPLTFEFQTNHWNRMSPKIAFGPITGFLLKGTQRYKLENGKKIKEKGDYGFNPFQYGVFARIGVGTLGFYGKYYFNDIFSNSPHGYEMQNLSLGLTLCL